MPRRNNRHREQYQPLDLTPADVRRPPAPTGYQSSADIRRAQAERHRELAKRQHDARVNKGIDWEVCLVPGCGHELRMWGNRLHSDPAMRDHTVRLPLCIEHLCVAYQQAKPGANDPLMVEANTRLLERREAKQAELHKAHRERWKARTDGHIYFVRLNGLVKVGWSRGVDDRLRAYGPDVEVLCIYPGTRDDETNLHRQLRPVLAAGREWYQDCAIIADYVAQALAEHGEPEVFTEWTRPKEVIRPRRRSA